MVFWLLKGLLMENYLRPKFHKNSGSGCSSEFSVLFPKSQNMGLSVPFQSFTKDKPIGNKKVKPATKITFATLSIDSQ